MKKEVRVCYDDIADPQKITPYNKRLFLEHGMDIHRHECDLEDDPDRKERIMKIQPERKYFFR
jgi:hypothetical protein